jgi:predicted phage terminase large subunit-like protein
MNITPSPLKHYTTIQQYIDFAKRFIKFKDEKEKFKLNRLLCRTDLFWLLWHGCNKHYVAKQWLLDRCKEVEAKPNDCLDLWAREHFKSTIGTYGKCIQDIIASHGDDPLPEWNREATIGIFSITRPLAKSFLREIKTTFENKALPLTTIFPDIFYKNPKGESPKWSEDEGIIVKRKNITREATIEAWGLVDGQPTGKHFYGLIYDDIVTDKSVTTPEMIQKTTDALALSSNLGTEGGYERYYGTIYHANDTYSKLRKNKYVTTRIYPCTEEGTWPGTPVLKSEENLSKKYVAQGAYIFSCQMLLNPVADSMQNFQFDWLKYYGGWDKKRMVGNIYIMCDPANSKKKTSDYTVFMVVAAVSDGNYYVVDIVRDRLNLKERTSTLFSLVSQYRPVLVGYEQYGMQSDIEHIQEKMQQLNYRFHIKELGGKTAKNDRIGKLVPDFENSKIYLPFELRKKNYEGKIQDLIDIFVNEEYLTFPTPEHDDMLDCLARIKDDAMNVEFPVYEEEEEYYQENFSRQEKSVTGY